MILKLLFRGIGKGKLFIGIQNYMILKPQMNIDMNLYPF